jgi:hypothetical protein
MRDYHPNARGLPHHSTITGCGTVTCRRAAVAAAGRAGALVERGYEVTGEPRNDMDDELKAAAKAASPLKDAPLKNLTPWEAELLVEVLADHPGLTPERALAGLRAEGM